MCFHVNRCQSSKSTHRCPVCRWLGVDHVFLTDNGSANFGSVRAKLAKQFPAAFLTLRSESYDRAQLKVYAWCAETQRDQYNWLAFFDLDEFLVLRGAAAQFDPDRPPNVRALLDEYKHTAALAVNWIWVGPSGRKTRPPGGGVLQHYNQCVPDADKHIKSIVNTFYLDGVAVHPHNFHYRCIRSPPRNTLRFPAASSPSYTCTWLHGDGVDAHELLSQTSWRVVALTGRRVAGEGCVAKASWAG